jgi:hypothetical protein
MITAMAELNLVVVRKSSLLMFALCPYSLIFLDDVLLQMEATEHIVNQIRLSFRDILRTYATGCSEAEVFS